MKNLYLYLLLLLSSSLFYSQFTIDITMNKSLGDEVIVSKLSGSKYIIVDSKKLSTASKIKVKEPFVGRMRLYWPSTNQQVHFISENKDVDLKIEVKDNKISKSNFSDDTNLLMEKIMDRLQKKENIYPALTQIKPFYRPNTEFYKALDNEIKLLESPVVVESNSHPFISYYNNNYQQFILNNSEKKALTKEEISQFLISSNDLLESSGLIRPILIQYLNLSRNDIETNMNSLLEQLQVETPRGQIVLSEVIDLFSTYGMENLEQKYLDKAKGLKCTITDRLENTLKTHANTQIGAKFPNYSFTSRVSNTNARSIHDVQSEKKIVLFWSSQCGHCKKAVPELVSNYSLLKSKGVEIIGLSVDLNEDEYQNEIKSFKWINDTELRGWNSSFTEVYNISGTPTYFILDKDNTIIAKPVTIADVLKYFEIK